MVWNRQEVAVEQFAYVSFKVLRSFWNLQEVVWNLQTTVVTPFLHFRNEIGMVLESLRSCFEAMIDGLQAQDVAATQTQ